MQNTIVWVSTFDWMVQTLCYVTFNNCDDAKVLILPQLLWNPAEIKK